MRMFLIALISFACMIYALDKVNDIFFDGKVNLIH